MTIAVSVKVIDGIVLAADSASIIKRRKDTGEFVIAHTYENASKICNLYKGLPLGVVSWGLGSIGLASISALMKNFRTLLCSDGKFEIDTEKYETKEIAENLRTYIFDLYKTESEKWGNNLDDLGLLIVGYSTNEKLPEEYLIIIREGECPEPMPLRHPDTFGIFFDGIREPLARVVSGVSEHLPTLLEEKGFDKAQIKDIMHVCDKLHLTHPLIHPAMPIQDAIDFARFLVRTAIDFVRFAPGADYVGGPIDIASITRYEGFKWIQRKNFYKQELNPEV